MAKQFLLLLLPWMMMGLASATLGERSNIRHPDQAGPLLPGQRREDPILRPVLEAPGVCLFEMTHPKDKEPNGSPSTLATNNGVPMGTIGTVNRWWKEFQSEFDVFYQDWPTIKFTDCDELSFQFLDAKECNGIVDITLFKNGDGGQSSALARVECSNRSVESVKYIVTQKDPIFEVHRFGPDEMFTTVIAAKFLNFGWEISKGITSKFVMPTGGNVKIEVRGGIGGKSASYDSDRLRFAPYKAARDHTTLAFIYPDGAIYPHLCNDGQSSAVIGITDSAGSRSMPRIAMILAPGHDDGMTFGSKNETRGRSIFSRFQNNNLRSSVHHSSSEIVWPVADGSVSDYSSRSRPAVPASVVQASLADEDQDRSDGSRSRRRSSPQSMRPL